MTHDAAMRVPVLLLLLLGPGLARVAAQDPGPAFDAPELLFRGHGLIEGGAPVGVPLGGLGTGRLDFCADGSFRHLTLGPTTALLELDESAFFELEVERDGAPAARRALRSGGAGDVPGVAQLAYRGLFPRAFLRAGDAALGVATEIEACAPLVPHDVEASTWPCIGFLVTLREETGHAARTTLTLHAPAQAGLAVTPALAGLPAPGVTFEPGDGSLAAHVALPAGGSAQVLLALAWTVHDHPAAARSADAQACAAAFLQRWPALHEGTRAWQALLFASGLPRWHAERLCNDLAPLATNTRVSAAGVLSTAESGSGLGGITGTLDQRRVAAVAMAAFFPALDLSELQVFAAQQEPGGRVPHHVGTLDGPLRPGKGMLDWPDVACSFSLQVLKTWLWNGDRAAIAPLVPHVRAALAWLVAQDADGDGIPDGGSTFDYARAPRGFSYTATISLAALEAGRRLGTDLQDGELVQLCSDAAPRVRDALLTRLWNGRWFVSSVAGDLSDARGGSFLSQLAGEWSARAFGLGPLLPPALVERAADSLVALHGHASPFIPPMEVEADGRTGPAPWGWLPYAETDYASLLLQLGRADEAWATLAGLDRMVVEASGEPFDVGLYYDPITGRNARAGYDWYMSTPASWWTLYATAGFGLDVPRGELTLAPNLPTTLRRAALPLFAPGFTAQLDVEDAPFGVTRTLELHILAVHGRPLELKRLVTRAPVAAGPSVVLEIQLDGAPLPATVMPSSDGSQLIAVLDLPATLAAGSTLRVRLADPGSDVAAALQASEARRTQVLENDQLRVELRTGERGLQRAVLRDRTGHEALLDVGDLFQLLVLPAAGDERDIRTDGSWDRRVRVAQVQVTRDGDAPDAPCRLSHRLELRQRTKDTDFEPLEVEVEVALDPGQPVTRWRLRARGPVLAGARAVTLRFPRLGLEDPQTVGEALRAELSTPPGTVVDDPVHALDVLTDWIAPAAPAWVGLHGPRGTLELRGADAGAWRRIAAQGDGRGAVALALLVAAQPRGPDAAGDEDLQRWAAGWDAAAEAYVGLR